MSAGSSGASVIAPNIQTARPVGDRPGGSEGRGESFYFEVRTNTPSQSFSGGFSLNAVTRPRKILLVSSS
jgi:hypothetical protein